MNLGPQKISTTYPYVINKSGSAFTLGDGSVINWADAEVVVTSGTVAQQIGGLKTFTSNLTIPSTLNFTSQGSFVKAGNHAVTLNTSAAPTITFASTNARTYTIPDPGANASFIMSTGNQNISGVVTAGGLFLNSSGIQLNRGQLLRWGANGESTDDANIVVSQNAADQTSMKFRIGDVSDANDTFIFERGDGAGGDGADLMTIRADGRVGIGTSSPEVKLDVANPGSSEIRLLESVSNVDTRVSSVGGGGQAGIIGTYSNHALVNYTNSLERMRITSLGDVGIGTLNPLSKLDVNGSINLNGNINLNGPNKKLILYSGAPTSNAYIQAESNGEVSVYNGTAGVSKKLTVTSAGAVGIGTGTPSNSLLHIYGNDYTKGLKIENSNPAQYNGANLYLKNASGNFRSTSIIHGNNSVNGKESVFSINGNNDLDTYVQTLAAYYYDPIHAWSIKTSGQDAVIINHLGDVGIGTTSPTQKLDVHGSIKASGLQLTRGQLLRWGPNNDNNDDANITVINVGSDQTEMRFRIGDGNDLNDKFVFQQGNAAGGSSNTPMMTIQANGNVGIGTGNPAYKLDIVSGGARILHPGGDSNLELGVGTTTNQYAYVDFVGDTTYTDYGLRVLRGNTGPNTFSNIYHRGTGLFTIGTQDGAPMMLITSGQERLTISGNGNTTVNGNLQVNGRIDSTNGVGLSNVNVKLQAEQALPTVINAFTGVISTSLSSGTWLVNSSILHSNINAAAENIFVRISGSSTIYASSMQSRPAVANYGTNLSLTTIIPLTTATTITLQAASSVANAATPTSFIKTGISPVSQGNHSTQLTAVRIG